MEGSIVMPQKQETRREIHCLYFPIWRQEFHFALLFRAPFLLFVCPHNCKDTFTIICISLLEKWSLTYISVYSAQAQVSLNSLIVCCP